MDRLIEFSNATTLPPQPFLAQHPQDQVLAELLSASEIALRHPDPAVVRLAEATQRRVHEIQRDIRRRLARQKAEITAAQVELLVERIACALRTDSATIRGDSRKLHVAFQRQVTVYLARRISGASYPTIAVAINRDHSTAIHSFQTVACRAARDTAFRSFVQRLEQQISGATMEAAAA
jgi:chromosomal replication initiator protein